ncbi:MAG TPA: hypothetical protein VI911_00915 [Patescibacteria group bacterium]|nr:hypothetical protein [Patescibacteria group bacterium]
MKVLVSNNKVILGPTWWNQNMFQSVLTDELGLNFTLPTITEDSAAYSVSDTVKILPVEFTAVNYDHRIQQLAGPNWTIQADKAIASYTVVDRPIEAVRNELKAKVANLRWQKEVSGTKITLQDQEIGVATDRETRNMYSQALLLGVAGVNWKFGNTWLVLSLADLQVLVSAVLAHIQAQFEWESGIVTSINNAVDLNTLTAIDDSLDVLL